MGNVVIYTRVSSKEQLEGSSLETQQRICSDFAYRSGHEIIKTYIEQGESAKTANRTELKALLGYVSKNSKNLEAVIVYKVDRLARNILDYAQIKLLLNQLGVKLLSATEDLAETPVGRWIGNQLASTAQFDNEVRAERCTGGMIDAVKKGRYVWKAPVGYINVGTKGNSNITPQDDETARLVRKCWELIDNGMNIEEARRSMTNEGLRGKSKKPISRASFHKMIKNKIYMGVIEKFNLSIVGTFTPIVEQELFLRVQERLNSKNRKTPVYKKDNEDFPLRGLVTCGHCQNRMTASWSTGNGGKFAYYRCSKCNKVNYKKEIVEGKFIEYLKHHSYEPEFQELLMKAIQENLNFRNEANSKKVKELERELLIQKTRANQIVDKNLKGVVNDNLARELLAQNDEKISELSLEADKFKTDPQEDITIVEHSIKILGNISETWLESDFEIKKRFQKFLFPEGLMFNGQEFGTSKLPLCIGVILSKKSSLVDPSGFEPLTSTLQMWHSNQLNYGPIIYNFDNTSGLGWQLYYQAVRRRRRNKLLRR